MSQEQTYRCQDCSCIFFTIRDLAKHKLAFHLTEGEAHKRQFKELHRKLEQGNGEDYC